MIRIWGNVLISMIDQIWADSSTCPNCCSLIWGCFACHCPATWVLVQLLLALQLMDELFGYFIVSSFFLSLLDWLSFELFKLFVQIFVHLINDFELGGKLDNSICLALFLCLLLLLEPVNVFFAFFNLFLKSGNFVLELISEGCHILNLPSEALVFILLEADHVLQLFICGFLFI